MNLACNESFNFYIVDIKFKVLANVSTQGDIINKQWYKLCQIWHKVRGKYTSRIEVYCFISVFHLHIKTKDQDQGLICWSLMVDLEIMVLSFLRLAAWCGVVWWLLLLAAVGRWKAGEEQETTTVTVQQQFLCIRSWCVRPLTTFISLLCPGPGAHLSHPC